MTNFWINNDLQCLQDSSLDKVFQVRIEVIIIYETGFVKIELNEKDVVAQSATKLLIDVMIVFIEKELVAPSIISRQTYIRTLSTDEVFNFGRHFRMCQEIFDVQKHPIWTLFMPEYRMCHDKSF